MTETVDGKTVLRAPVRGTSLSRQAQEILVERIKNGTYPTRRQIPPENDLASEFNVSRATIRSAISALVERGWLVRRHGVGTFVSQLSNISNPLSEAEDFSYLIARNGFEPGVQYVKVAVVQPDPRAAAALKIEAGASVLQSYKIFTANDEPVIYCITSIPTTILGDDLTRESVANPTVIEPLFDLLEQRCNERTEYHVTKVRAEIARNCEFPNLPFDPATPLLFMEEVGYNPNHAPLWHSLVYFPTNHMTFELVRHRVRR